MKLFQMLVKWVIFYILVLFVVLEELVKMLMEPEKRVSWTTFFVFLLEVGVFLRICPMVGLKGISG